MDSSPRKMKELDKRLFILKKIARFSAFRISGSDKGRYFSSAFEHRAVMQVIVLCLIGLYEEPVIQGFVLFIKWYIVATRSSIHTSNSLINMDELMSRYVTHSI